MLKPNAISSINKLCRGRHHGLDRRRSTSTCSSSSTCIITAINIDRSSSSTTTKQCLTTGRQVVLIVTREPTGPKVVVDGVLLHVIHHVDDLVWPRLRSSTTRGPMHHLQETCKQQARKKEDTIRTQKVRVRDLGSRLDLGIR
jgi:hypothetical protein